MKKSTYRVTTRGRKTIITRRKDKLTSLSFAWMLTTLAFSAWSFYMGMNYKLEGFIPNTIFGMIWAGIWLSNGFVFRMAIEYRMEETK